MVRLRLQAPLCQSQLHFPANLTAGSMSSLAVPPPQRLLRPLAVPHRHMFGPGPSNVPPRILEAGAKPVIGHMHPEIFEVNSCTGVQRNPAVLHTRVCQETAFGGMRTLQFLKKKVQVGKEVKTCYYLK